MVETREKSFIETGNSGPKINFKPQELIFISIIKIEILGMPITSLAPQTLVTYLLSIQVLENLSLEFQ